MQTYTPPRYPYTRPPADAPDRARPWPVIVVGAGPVGLSAAIDLALHGIEVLVLDEDDTVSVGSRAICWSKRTLEIFDRLGCAEPLLQKGVRWQVGRVFFRDEQVYQFDLLPEPGHRRPAFINLQQYHVEQLLVQHLAALPGVDLRWRHRVVGIAPQADRIALTVSTPDGEYAVEGRWLIVADGAKSTLCGMLGLESDGQVFRDRFLIADIHMTSNFPAERWFWFDPPFHPRQSALLHRQADDVWRVDFQLGWDADPDEEKKPEKILPRLRAMLGKEVRFELEWASVYTFQCRRLRSFRHGRALIAGDAAHLVSPFGARGANGGVQDADNLVWKLALVVSGRAPERLLDSYDSERVAAADENIRHSTHSTEFITPKSAVSRTFRDAVLLLAKRHAFARQLVNSGRLSQPVTLSASPLNTADAPGFAARMAPGSPALDAPVTGAVGTWLLDYLGNGFTLLIFAAGVPLPDLLRDLTALRADPIRCNSVLIDVTGGDLPPGIEAAVGSRTLAERYDARPGTTYLFRPDQHVCARWRAFDLTQTRAAIARATGHTLLNPRPCSTPNPTSPHPMTSTPS